MGTVEGGVGFIILGMRFDPEEEDLLRYYLMPKINGDPLPWGGIKEFDVYGKQGPCDIIHGSESAEAYVFAISKNKSRKQRTCEFGTWKQQKCTPVVDHQQQGQTMGYGAYLSFYPDEGISPGFLGGSWNMTEYCLKGHEKNEGYIVCKGVLQGLVPQGESPKGFVNFVRCGGDSPSHFSYSHRSPTYQLSCLL